MKNYRAYGLNIITTVDLPELPAAIGDPDVQIRTEKISLPWHPESEQERAFTQTDDGILLTWDQFGRFLIRDGREILVDPVPHADETYIRHLLLGPVLSVLNFQRGLSIFHASAVVFPSGGAAFMARAGLGKSTQAAAFVRRGKPLVTDDVLLLKPDGRDMIAIPGVPFLKLWPETLAMLGENPDHHPQTKTNLLKRTLNKMDESLKNPVPLRAVYLLEPGLEIEINLLAPKDALNKILPHWYGAQFQGELLPVLGIERCFRECAELVQKIPIYSVKRPPALDLLPAVCEAIECSL